MDSIKNGVNAEVMAQCHTVARKEYLETISETLEESVEFASNLLSVKGGLTPEMLDIQVREFVTSRQALNMADKAIKEVIFPILFKSYRHSAEIVYDNTELITNHLNPKQCGKTE